MAAKAVLRGLHRPEFQPGESAGTLLLDEPMQTVQAQLVETLTPEPL